MHVAMEVIARKEGIKWVHVPYKGSAPSITAVLGGHVDACSAGIGWQVHAKSGAVRALADHGKKRGAEFPDVPTLWELGYGFSNETVHAIVGPAGLPPEVKKKLEEGFVKGMETPEFKSAQEKLYLSPVHYDSKAYDKHLKERWVNVERIMMKPGLSKRQLPNRNDRLEQKLTHRISRCFAGQGFFVSRLLKTPICGVARIRWNTHVTSFHRCGVRLCAPVAPQFETGTLSSFCIPIQSSRVPDQIPMSDMRSWQFL
jgi:hypothetical protein